MSEASNRPYLSIVGWTRNDGYTPTYAERLRQSVGVLLRQLEMVHAWRRFPALDPSLPRELLPVRWSGIKAAELFADRHERWLEDARREWKRLNSLN